MICHPLGYKPHLKFAYSENKEDFINKIYSDQFANKWEFYFVDSRVTHIRRNGNCPKYLMEWWHKVKLN
jgi:hypothetical protein